MRPRQYSMFRRNSYLSVGSTYMIRLITRFACMIFIVWFILSEILRLPLGFSNLLSSQGVENSFLIAVSISSFEHLYGMYVPSKQYRCQDLLMILAYSLIIIFVAYLDEPYILLYYYTLGVALCTFLALRWISRTLTRKSRPQNLNTVQANRNHLALSLFILSLVIPISLISEKTSQISFTSSIPAYFNEPQQRENMIMHYLKLKYQDDLAADQWSQQKIADFLQDIEYIEANATFRKPAIVKIKELPKSTLASYNLRSNQIHINTNYLNTLSLEEMIALVLHEGRHVYQFQLIIQVNWKNPIVQNSPYFSDLNRIFADFSDYSTSAEEDFDTYFDQYIEIDARKFSEEILPIYLQWLKNP